MAKRGYIANSVRLAHETFSPDEWRVIQAIRHKPARLRARLERFAEAGRRTRATWPAEVPKLVARSVELLCGLEEQQAPSSHGWLPLLLQEASNPPDQAGI